MTTNNVASTSTLTPNPDAPPPAPPKERASAPADSETSSAAPEDPPQRRRRRRKGGEASPVQAPKVPGEVHLAALGRLVLEAAKQGLTVSEYAEQHLLPMVEALALYEAVSPQQED